MIKSFITLVNVFLAFVTMDDLAIAEINIETAPALPLVINTWNFLSAAVAARKSIVMGGDALDAVVAGCTQCEEEQCDLTVGYGGSPDENGETTLDAMVMDGASLNVGAVGALRRVKNAVGVARAVLERTRHSLIVGSQASEFASSMGFPLEDLHTDESKRMWKEWKDNHCQPNFWTRVRPDPTTSCGPYHPTSLANETNEVHDTIGMIVIDSHGHVVVGTSTNGARHKIPGRVGDSPIPGSGAYSDDSVGGAVATGDGDIMMRFLPSYQAVENMRLGMNPRVACVDAIKRIIKRHPDFSGALVAATVDGKFDAACHGLKNGRFPFSVWNPSMEDAVVKYVDCV